MPEVENRLGESVESVFHIALVNEGDGAFRPHPLDDIPVVFKFQLLQSSQQLSDLRQ